MNQTKAKQKLLVPFALNLEHEDGVKLRWVEADRMETNEPFFDQNILNYFFQSNPHFLETELLELFYSVGQQDTVAPSGFIFHMSRCGSTLLTNMLRQNPEIIAVGEPGIVSDLLYLIDEDNAAYVTELLKAAIQSLGQKRTGAEKHFVVKFSSPMTVFLPYIKAAFPEVPSVFLYRDPVEVLVSNLKDPEQGWIYTPQVVGVDTVAITEQNSVVENCALALKNTCESYLQQMGPGSMVANYTQFSPALFDAVLQQFQIQASPRQRAQMLDQMRYYSKGKKQSFVKDSSQKKKGASEKVQQVADRYLSHVYQQLEAAKLTLPV